MTLHNFLVFCFFVLQIAVIFSGVYSVEDSHDHDGDGDAYHKVVDYLDNVDHGDERNITLEEMNTVIGMLWDRVQCSEIDFTGTNTNCTECLSAESLFTIVGADTLLGLDEAGYHRASVVLLYYLTDLRSVCKDISEPSAKSYEYFAHQVFNYNDPDNSSQFVLTFDEFEEILEDVNETYVAENYAKCFTDHTVFYDDVSLDNSTIGADDDEMEELAAVTISYYLFGYCYGSPTEVDPDSFVDSIFALYGHDGVIHHHDFESMLEKMNIGTGDHSHDDVHSHVQKRSIADMSYDHVVTKLSSNKRTVRAVDDHDHDHDHDHDVVSVDECFVADELMDIYDVNETEGISRQKFIEMCPSLVQQIVSDACVEPVTDISPASAIMYLWGTLIVLFISLMALLGILLIPLASKVSYHRVMHTMIALAVGTMTSDALLHLIPEALGLHGHSETGHSDDADHDRTDLWKMTTVLGSVYGFYLLERIMGLVSGHLNKSKIDPEAVNGTSTHGHGSHHHHSHAIKPEISTSSNNKKITVSSSQMKLCDTEDQTVANGDVHAKEEKKDTGLKSCFTSLNSVAVMIIVGDALHNLADGLAIGAALCIDLASGISTGIAVLCHEVPHELGDFAVLVSSGLSHSVAIAWNFFCACCAFIGLYIGLAVGSTAGASEWILAVTAGMFLYVALVDMMPELLSPGTTEPWIIFAFQNIGFLVGFTIILLLAYYEEDISVGTGI
ncbi:zinc transporter ZIP12-like [Glandiceps talaboti]